MGPTYRETAVDSIDSIQSRDWRLDTVASGDSRVATRDSRLASPGTLGQGSCACTLAQIQSVLTKNFLAGEVVNHES